MCIRDREFVGVTVTDTYTIPYDGTYRILLVGAGGSGWISNTGGSVGSGIGSGGGGGFAMIHAMELSAGDTVAYTLGARTQVGPGTDIPGQAGGDSTVSINGTQTLTAAGGGGGNIGVGGAGGAATGGDFRLDGQDGNINNVGATGGLGGLATINPAGTDVIATYLGNLASGNMGNGGISSTNAGSSTGNSAAVAIQGSGMTN